MLWVASPALPGNNITKFPLAFWAGQNTRRSWPVLVPPFTQYLPGNASKPAASLPSNVSESRQAVNGVCPWVVAAKPGLDVHSREVTDSTRMCVLVCVCMCMYMCMGVGVGE